jgi:hypothetical protein
MFGFGFSPFFGSVVDFFTKIVKNFRAAVIADGGTFEAFSCMINVLKSIGETIYNSASIVTTANGYKAGVFYSVKGADYTVTRASTKTRINALGNIESVGNNVPALTYINGCPSVHVEAQITNRFQRSQPTATAHMSSSSNLSFSTTHVFPNGLVGGVLFGNNSLIRVARPLNIGTVIGNTYTLLFYVQMDDGGEPFNGFGSSNDFIISIAEIGIATHQKINVKDDLWLFRATHVATNASTVNGLSKLTSNSARTFKATGFMLIEGDVPITSSYIPTTGATATRLADVISTAVPVGTTEIIETFADNTVNTITTIPTTHTLTTNRFYKSIVMKP